MGYQFIGFFVDSQNPDMRKEILNRWPMLRTRDLWTPFYGMGFAFSSDVGDSKSNEEAEKIIGEQDSVREFLPWLSIEYPESKFLWIEANCAGGNCLYEGFVYCSGEALIQEEASKAALAKLLKLFDVEIGEDNFFEPFVRGFFWR